MIASLRRKFMAAAMISLAILMGILTAGAAVLGYVRMERSAEETLKSLTEKRRPPGPGKRPPYPAFGYRVNPDPMPAGVLIASVSPEGEVCSVEYLGMMELEEEEVRAIVRNALAEGASKGKTGSYKYVAAAEKDGSLRLFFLDMSFSTRILLNTVFALLLAGAISMGLLFVILFLVSGRVIRPLAENIEKQRQFVSNAGHEMKTPLGILMANTDALELYQGESRWSRNIRSQTERMHRLMESLLLLARMDEGGGGIPLEAVDWSCLAEKRAAEFAETARIRGIKIKTVLTEGLVVFAEPGYLDELLGILLDNAVKYGAAGEEVQVCLEAVGRKVRLTVENAVEVLPNVPPETLFDRFYRADAARTQKEGGCGIGLSAARAIVQMFRGRIEASYLGENRIRLLVELPASSPEGKCS